MLSTSHMSSFATSQVQIIGYWKSANRRAAEVRFELLRNLAPEQIDQEYSNLHASITWLAEQNDETSAALLLNFLDQFAPYLHQRQFDLDLEHWCESGLQACEYLNRNPANILLIRGDAQFVLGMWNAADSSWQSAISESRENDPITHARALSALGRLQINQGRFKSGLANLSLAEELLQELNEIEEFIRIRSEVAAYHLNRRELDRALQIYQELDRLQTQKGLTSGHTMLMIGITYRQKRAFEKAIAYLSRCYQQGEANNDLSGMATAAHHLAWAYLEQGNLEMARQFCGQALAFYQEINDPRGLSDSFEQLGAIFTAERNVGKAKEYINLSIQMRQELGNRPGLVSSLRRLALAQLLDRNYKQVILLIFRVLYIYTKLGLLSRQRAFALMHDFISGLRKAFFVHTNEKDNMAANDREISVMETFSKSLFDSQRK